MHRSRGHFAAWSFQAHQITVSIYPILKCGLQPTATQEVPSNVFPVYQRSAVKNATKRISLTTLPKCVIVSVHIYDWTIDTWRKLLVSKNIQLDHDRQSSGSGSLSSIRCNVTLALMRSRTSLGGPLDFDLELGYKSTCKKRSDASYIERTFPVLGFFDGRAFSFCFSEEIYTLKP
jgi:hypothetical protein